MPYKDPTSPKAVASRKAINARSVAKRRASIKSPEEKAVLAAKSREKAAIERSTPEGRRQIKSRWLKHRFGLTMEQYENMIHMQGGICLICKKPLRVEDRNLDGESPVIDHDHDCCTKVKTCGNCIRGILHRNCNVGIGLLGDDPVTLRLAAEYLEQRQK